MLRCLRSAQLWATRARPPECLGIPKVLRVVPLGLLPRSLRPPRKPRRRLRVQGGRPAPPQRANLPSACFTPTRAVQDGAKRSASHRQWPSAATRGPAGQAAAGEPQGERQAALRGPTCHRSLHRPKQAAQPPVAGNAPPLPACSAPAPTAGPLAQPCRPRSSRCTRVRSSSSNKQRKPAAGRGRPSRAGRGRGRGTSPSSRPGRCST